MPTVKGALIAALAVCAALVLVALHYYSAMARAESDNRQLQSDLVLQQQTIATQAFNVHRFNQIAEQAARANAIATIGTEKTVTEYREILRREKTCDLPVPAAIASGLLSTAENLRSRAMHSIASQPDAADDRTAATGQLTYCQAVLWVAPLLATIEQGNERFAGIREAEQQGHNHKSVTKTRSGGVFYHSK